VPADLAAAMTKRVGIASVSFSGGVHAWLKPLLRCCMAGSYSADTVWDRCTVCMATACMLNTLHRYKLHNSTTWA
jgi:hypothetical protein